ALLVLAGSPHVLVAEDGPPRARRRVDDAKAEAPVREREDLLRRGRAAVAAGVGDDHDLELEPFRSVDRQEPDRVGSFLLRDRLELTRPQRLLLADETHEALDVRAAQLLVGTGEPRELAQVGVAARAVPARE